MNLVQLADLWEENQECLKQHLGQCDSDRFGARWVLMPTVPYPRFNHVSRIRVEEEQVEELIAAARAFFREQGIPTSTLMTTPATRPSDLGVRLYRMGFMTEANPVMIWSGLPLPAEDRVGLRVERVPRKDAALYWEMLRQVFFPGASTEMLIAGRRGVDISFEIGAINYIAYLGGRPAGAGTLFIHGQMAGIYNMCTLPRFQRNGVATAVLRACLADAQAAGCAHVGLTPTPMGRPLYERLGFREIYQELYFSQRIH
ncbi:MAG: GNAT family N-acetyltransferase [Bacillota bacterium]